MFMSQRHRRLLEDCNKILDGVPPGDLSHIDPNNRDLIVSVFARRHQLTNKNFRKYLKHPSFFVGNSITIDTLPNSYPKYCKFDTGAYRYFLTFLADLLLENPELANRVTTLRLVAPVEKKVVLVKSQDEIFKNELFNLIKSGVVLGPPEFVNFLERSRFEIEPTFIKNLYCKDGEFTDVSCEYFRFPLAVIALCNKLRRLIVVFAPLTANSGRSVQLLLKPSIDSDPFVKISNLYKLNDLQLALSCDAIVALRVVFGNYCAEFDFGDYANEAIVHGSFVEGTALQQLLSSVALAGSSPNELKLFNHDLKYNAYLEPNETKTLRNLTRLVWECSGASSDTIETTLDCCNMENMNLFLTNRRVTEEIQKREAIIHWIIVKADQTINQDDERSELTREDWLQVIIKYPSVKDKVLLNLMKHGTNVSIKAQMKCEYLTRWSYRHWIPVFGNYIHILHLVKTTIFQKQTADALLKYCNNLRSVKVDVDSEYYEMSAYDYFLSELFGDRNRAKQLLSVKIRNQMSAKTLNLAFSNCTKLEVFEIQCNEITDDHVKMWIRSGPKPSEVCFSAQKLTDAGLNGLIMVCGLHLKHLIIFDLNIENIDADFFTEAIVRFCPILQYLNCGTDINRRFLDDRLNRHFFYHIEIPQDDLPLADSSQEQPGDIDEVVRDCRPFLSRFKIKMKQILENRSQSNQ